MLRPELAVAQTLGEKPVYHIDDLRDVAGSRSAAYRILSELREAGFATQAKKGYFTLRSSLFQPYSLWPYLLSPLEALSHARHFGRSYNENDVRVARSLLNGAVTLDYRAYELTSLQEPHTLYVYVSELDEAVSILRAEGFSEGRRGRVALLPRLGDFENELQRLYLDCIAFGGRSTLDAIAIEILYSEELDGKIRGRFGAENILKVNDELGTGENREGSR